jgi:hypothetical protein
MNVIVRLAGGVCGAVVEEKRQASRADKRSRRTGGRVDREEWKTREGEKTRT